MRLLLAALALLTPPCAAAPVLHKTAGLVLDLRGAGVLTGARRVPYDIDGNGTVEDVADIAPGTGVLIFDADGDGRSGGTGRELFGDFTDLDGNGHRDGFRDGFDALWGLVDRAVRAKVLSPIVLAERRLEAAELRRLEEAYGLRIRIGGLVRRALSLRDAGIVALSLSAAPSTRVEDFDGLGDDLSRRAGATFTRSDGTTGSCEEIIFASRRFR